MAFFITFKGRSVAKICLRPECAPLRIMECHIIDSKLTFIPLR